MCFDQGDHDSYMKWLRYWASLDDAGRRREQQMMDDYMAELVEDRKHGGPW